MTLLYYLVNTYFSFLFHVSNNNVLFWHIEGHLVPIDTTLIVRFDLGKSADFRARTHREACNTLTMASSPSDARALALKLFGTIMGPQNSGVNFALGTFLEHWNVTTFRSYFFNVSKNDSQVPKPNK